MNNQEKIDLEKTKKVLVIGSYAKEHITLENIKEHHPDIKTYSITGMNNPGIIKYSDDYLVHDPEDIDKVLEYTGKISPDLVIILTAPPMNKGLADILIDQGYNVFGAVKDAAKLETDKAYTRRLMKRHKIDAVPEFKVFSEKEKATDFAEKLNWEVAVKPNGLTEGLGVKVYGDQLENPDDIIDYISEIIDENIGGEGKVIIEEKLEGEEFTLQCFVHNDKIVPTPLAQDYKKLKEWEKGPNTGSMGSVTYPDHGLPFLTDKEHQIALNYMRKTLSANFIETGKHYSGILYGQFMQTKNGLKLIEYNIRPGDPEWMNTLRLMEGSFLSIVIDLMNGNNPSPKFEKAATVCKYIAPIGYPKKLYRDLDIEIPEEKLSKLNVDHYISASLKDNGVLNPGTDRGPAFVAAGEDIEKAKELVHEAIDNVKGKFQWRKDIGSKKLMDKKLDSVRRNIRESRDYLIRNAREVEFNEIYDLISQTPPLEEYGRHFFKIMTRYFGNTTYVMEKDHEITGWVLGFRSQKHYRTYFLWQIGIKDKMQGKDAGNKLLDHVEHDLERKGFNRIEVTIDPENIPSQKLFEKRNYKNISARVGEPIEVNGNTGVKDYYREGAHFMVYEKLLE